MFSLLLKFRTKRIIIIFHQAKSISTCSYSIVCKSGLCFIAQHSSLSPPKSPESHLVSHEAEVVSYRSAQHAETIIDAVFPVRRTKHLTRVAMETW